MYSCFRLCVCMCVYVYIYKYTCMHACMHKYIHAYIQQHQQRHNTHITHTTMHTKSALQRLCHIERTRTHIHTQHTTKHTHTHTHTHAYTPRLKLVLNYEVRTKNRSAILAFASAGVAERIVPAWIAPDFKQEDGCCWAVLCILVTELVCEE